MDFLIQIVILKAEKKMAASQNNGVLRFVKLTERAVTPTRGSPRDAGLELHSAYDTTVPARGKDWFRQTCRFNFLKGVTDE